MNKKISVGLCLSIVFISIAATFALTMVASKKVYNVIISNISQRSQTYDTVDEISRIVSNYFYGNVDDYSALDGSLAEGYVNGLGDSNSKYFDADEYSQYIERLESGLTGVGVDCTYDYSSENLVLTYVYEGSPAEKSGLVVGDIISSVNGVAVTRNNYKNISESFYGSKLSTVKIDVLRNGENISFEPMLGFSIPSVIGKMINNVGYVKINGFYRNTASEFSNIINNLKSSGAEAIIFDVRNTSDGTIDYAVEVLDVIIPTIQGNLAVAKDKNNNIYKNKVYTSENRSFSMPFAVLVNGNTSGPAELFACDLKDISQAQVVGTKTAGNGTLQEFFTLESGGAVFLTVALIEPKGGATSIYNVVGVSPTLEVKLKNDDANLNLLTQEEDNQLLTALNIFA